MACKRELSPWLKKDPHEWTRTKMVFDITRKADITVLHFTHEGLSPEKESYDEFKKTALSIWDYAG